MDFYFMFCLNNPKFGLRFGGSLLIIKDDILYLAPRPRLAALFFKEVVLSQLCAENFVFDRDVMFMSSFSNDVKLWKTKLHIFLAYTIHKLVGKPRW